MIKVFCSLFIFTPEFLVAGTGHSKDMDLAYVLFLVALGLILLIWNGFDYLSKNREKLKSRMMYIFDFLKAIFSRKEKENFTSLFS